MRCIRCKKQRHLLSHRSGQVCEACEKIIIAEGLEKFEHYEDFEQYCLKHGVWRGYLPGPTSRQRAVEKITGDKYSKRRPLDEEGMRMVPCPLCNRRMVRIDNVRIDNTSFNGGRSICEECAVGKDVERRADGTPLLNFFPGPAAPAAPAAHPAFPVLIYRLPVPMHRLPPTYAGGPSAPSRHTVPPPVGVHPSHLPPSVPSGGGRFS